MSLEQRADDELKKKDVCEKLLHYWLQNPASRLGQLISNALYLSGKEGALFTIEDYDLIDEVGNFTRHQRNLNRN